MRRYVAKDVVYDSKLELFLSIDGSVRSSFWVSLGSGDSLSLRERWYENARNVAKVNPNNAQLVGERLWVGRRGGIILKDMSSRRKAWFHEVFLYRRRTFTE